MTETLLLAVLSALAVSAVSFLGATTIALQGDRFKKVTHLLLALAAGAMLGNALLHMLPHAMGHSSEISAIFETKPHSAGSEPAAHAHEAQPHSHGHHEHHGHDHDHDHGVPQSSTPSDAHDEAEPRHHEHPGLPMIAIMLVGFFTLFGVDLVLLSRGHSDKEGVRPLGYMVLFSDAMENFLDGLVIGAAYLISIPVGMAATVAILLHEVPMELGDFAVLTHSGFTKRKALLLNFLSGCVSLVGVAIAIVLGTTLEGFVVVATPFAAGAMLYLAATGLLPQIRRNGTAKEKAAYFCMTLLGVALMALVLLLE